MSGIISEVSEWALGHAEIADVIRIALKSESIVPASELASLGSIFSPIANGANSNASVGSWVGEGVLFRRAVFDASTSQIICERTFRTDA